MQSRDSISRRQMLGVTASAAALAVAGGGRFCDHLVVALGTASGDRDLRARLGKTEGERLAEPLVAAGHQGGASGQVER